MSISTRYPLPNDLKILELKTLDFLRTNHTVSTYYPTINSSANKYYNYIKYQNTSKIEINFEFDFDILISDELSKIFIGVLISSNQNGDSFQCITYYFAIAKGNSKPYTIIRKFHFDHVFENNDQKFPVYHLQYPGEQSPHIKEMCESKEYEKFLNPSLSEPRLCYQPMTLALILDLIFRDFKFKNNFHYIINDNNWRGIIKKNEEAVLKPFYSECNKFFNTSNSNSKFFTREYIYGLD